uniref:ER-bound oxygenase mpaB/mpaB'/Rubber oxygenase catalytic domain-containing protein n=1 Tax=Timema genevievae TaxID=629358 RepID=A0A7R9K3H4_TIMGE|nr:unnamed protein product [Timema genevievae]
MSPHALATLASQHVWSCLLTPSRHWRHNTFGHVSSRPRDTGVTTRLVMSPHALATLASQHVRSCLLTPSRHWRHNTGQEFFHQNYYALFVSKLSGLLTILVIPSILRVLVLTKQSGEPLTAFKRYLSTLSHMLDWYEGELMHSDSRASQSLLSVHSRHCAATHKAQKAGLGPISQLDMSLTQFGFMGYGLLYPRKLGLAGNEDDFEGFIHFWRTIGHVLGIEERFNICRESVLETRILCQRLVDEVFVAGLTAPPPQFAEMARSLLDGTWAMVPFIDHDAFLHFTKQLVGLRGELPDKASATTNVIHQFVVVSGATTCRMLTFHLVSSVNTSSIVENHSHDVNSVSVMYSGVLLALQVFVHEVLLATPIISVLVRFFLNILMWFSIYMAQRLPVLAYITWGPANVR